MQIPAQILAFLEDKLVAGPMLLPFHYPAAGTFEGYQSGFRFHGITGEDLTSETPGEWQPGWFVIARNGLGDPFFIDFREAQHGFPVYYAEHGAGIWEPVRISRGIVAFGALLREVLALGNDDNALLAYIKPLVEDGNPFWVELLEGLSEETPIETGPPLEPELCVYGRLVFKQAGPNRVKVAQYLRKYFGYNPAAALALLSGTEFALAEGFLVHLKGYAEDLLQLGAVALFEPDNPDVP